MASKTPSWAGQGKRSLDPVLYVLTSPGDEPQKFYDRSTHWVESRNPFFSEAEPFGCKNQVDVLKIKRQIKSYGCLILLP